MRAARKRVKAIATNIVVPKIDCASNDAMEEAATGMRMFALEKWVNADWTSKCLCETSWHHLNSNDQGLEDLCVNPLAHEDSHSRKIRTALCLDAMIEEETVIILTPMYNKNTGKRHVSGIIIREPLRAIRKRILRDPKRYDINSLDSDWWNVPIVTQHPIFISRSARATFPIGLYTDKVKYTRDDSFYRCSTEGRFSHTHSNLLERFL